MSDVMMKALQIQVESLTRQVETLGPENERVRKLLTEFDQRHDADQARIRELEAEKSEAYRRRDEWRKKAEGYDAVRLALREKVGDPWPPHMSRVLWAGIAADEKKRADDAEAKVAALREARGVRVKALEWEYHPVGIMAAPSTGHAYIFDTRMKGHFRSIKGFNPQRDFDTLDEAKAAAQADYERRFLAALEPGPVTVGEAARDKVRDAIAETIGLDAYDCVRVWDAWSVRTMSADDFIPIADNDERLAEIVDAVFAALADAGEAG